MRYRAKKRQDKRYFSATAAKTKSINLNEKIMRGGIRL